MSIHNLLQNLATRQALHYYVLQHLKRRRLKPSKKNGTGKAA